MRPKGFIPSKKSREKMSKWLKNAYRVGKKKPVYLPNEKNPSWKGDNAGYHAMHKWMASNYGSPRYCELCKRIDKKKYEWANKYHTYKRRKEDYMRVCTSCHRKYDYENIID